MTRPLASSGAGAGADASQAGTPRSCSGDTPLIELRGVSHRFGTPPAAGPMAAWARRIGLARAVPVTQALEGIDLLVRPGEVVGLVGESGCGKSTLGRIAAGLLRPSSGEVLVDGVPRWVGPANAKASGTSTEAANTLSSTGRGAGAVAPGARQLPVQMIFQDPFGSLNPRLRVSRIVGEAPLAHGLVDAASLDDYVCAQLERAGLDPALRHRYPHQFSGGQRQRIGIARALAVQPRMLVCDEAVAALDVSIQAQILNLFMDLRDELGLTYLFISHDLGVIEHLCDRVVVMYLGRVVESAPVEQLFAQPRHPYTQALLSEIPRIDQRRTRFSALQGEIPSPLAPPSGCHFHPRCPQAIARCRHEVPALRPLAAHHRGACHLAEAATGIAESA